MVSIQEKEEIKIYDAYAKEFWWQDSESNYILAPAFVIKPITKKQIVEFYNNSSKGKINPFTKSYSNIKMEVLVKEIFEFSRKK